MGTPYQPYYAHVPDQAHYHGQPQPYYYPPHPGQKPVPRYHKEHRGSGTKWCLRCPNYDVKEFAVKSFNLNDNTLETDFKVSVEADNPNDKISILYEKGSMFDVSYQGTRICSGSGPEFQQPTRNVTMLNISLEGKNDLNSNVKDSFIEDQKNGKIPLDIHIYVPIKFALENSKSKIIDVMMKCYIEVDSLKRDKKSKILNKICYYKVNF
ncbi:LEA_2 domain-containing protein [Gossypium australe]|uniref:LEA_2 domain-containing protein n=1 Tax=Gossypium australe TaxID=47621 RepID=A0A5B6WLN5_9ROSI|nr:LEA_2 domain-containing protein [Gossypium australe]